MKSEINIERVFLYLAIFLSGLISILDLFNLLAIPWLEDRIPALTLLLLSALFGYLSTVINKQLSQLEDTTNIYKSYMQKDAVQKLLTLRQEIDPNLEVIIGEHVSELLTNLEQVVKHKTLYLQNINLFRFFFLRTLEKYPRTTFLAISIADKNFFWRDHQAEEAMARFIKNRGKIRRVFFVSQFEEQGHLEEVLFAQYNIGVEIYIINAIEVPPHLKMFFFVDAKGRLGWESFVGPTNQMASVRATSDEHTIKKYIKSFDELLNLKGIKKYAPKNKLKAKL